MDGAGPAGARGQPVDSCCPARGQADGEDLVFHGLPGWHEACIDLLPADQPRYFMGLGDPVGIVESVARGVDMFDCVLPTRSGRHGQAWTWAGPINVKNAKFAEDLSPLDEAVDCPASRDYSRAYYHHLFRAGEYLGPMLLSWHNGTKRI